MDQKNFYKDGGAYSPLELLFSTYSNDRLPEPPEAEEKQRSAYLCGLRTGFRLALELQEED